jgi:ankyrin repeat protein
MASPSTLLSAYLISFVLSFTTYTMEPPKPQLGFDKLFQEAESSGNFNDLRPRLTSEALHVRNQQGWTLLHTATLNQHVRVMEFLIDSGIPVNVVTTKGETPLHIAAAQNCGEPVLRLLLRKGAALNAKTFNRASATALALAQENQHDAVVQFLKRESSLHEAAKQDNPEKIRYLLNQGFPVGVSDEEGLTPLQVAAKLGKMNALRALLDSFGQSEEEGYRKYEYVNKGTNRKTALHYAAEQGHESAVRTLLESGAKKDDKKFWESNHNIGSPLHCAAQNGHADVIKILLAAGANVNALLFSKTPLFLATREGHEAAVTVLLEAGGASVENLLHTATWKGHSHLVQLFIHRGHNVNARVISHFHEPTVLHNAAAEGHTETVKVLLDSNAEINAPDKFGETALHRALLGYYLPEGQFCEGHLQTAQLLVERNADLSKTMVDGATPLHLAAKHGFLDLVRLMIAKGAVIINAKDKKLMTPLHFAAANGHHDIVFELLTHQALIKELINAPTEDGFTALQFALVKTHENAARLLIAYGAQLDLGLNADDVAATFANKPLVLNAILGNLPLLQSIFAIEKAHNSPAELELQLKEAGTCAEGLGREHIAKWLMQCRAAQGQRRNPNVIHSATP